LNKNKKVQTAGGHPGGEA